MLGVDVVDPDGLVAHQHLARSRVGRGHLDRAQHLRTAVRVDPHREHVRHFHWSVTIPRSTLTDGSRAPASRCRRVNGGIYLPIVAGRPPAHHSPPEDYMQNFRQVA
jgi:hypothetical protein